MENNRILKGDGKGNYILYIGEQQSFCPFTPPLKVQNQFGAMDIIRLPCTSSCPHFKLFTLSEVPHVGITCGHGQDFEVKVDNPENDSNVIQIV